MMTHQTLRNLFLIFSLLLAFSLPAQAQFFGISGDSAIAYSASEDAVSGGSVGITHPVPFVPNFGGAGVYFTRRDRGSDIYTLNSKVKVLTGNLFYHLPVPTFSFTLGAGAGAIEVNTDIIETIGTVETVKVRGAVGEAFVRLGLPFYYLFDFHLGYHYFTMPDIDLVKDSETSVKGLETEINFSGGMTTVGFQLAL